MAPEAAVPLQRLSPSSARETREGVGIPLVPSLPCLQCPWTCRPTTAAEPPGRSGETPLVSITLAHLSHRSVAWLQSHAGSRAGCWGTQAGHKSGQCFFLILNEAQPMQGRDGGGLPTFPISSSDHGRQRRKKLAPTTCWSERGEGSIIMRHRHSWSSALALQTAWRSLCPVFPPTNSSSGGSSRAPSLALKGLGIQGMRKAGSEELYQHAAARHQLAPLKEMCQKIRVTLVPDSPEEDSREKAPTDRFFPMGYYHNPKLSHPPGSWCRSGGTHPSLCPKTAWDA